MSTNDGLIAELRERAAHPRTGSNTAQCMSEAANALEAAERERDDLEERLAGYLCDSTGGLLSKTGYDVRTMVQHTEEYYDKIHATARAEIERRAESAEAKITAVEALHQPWEETGKCRECSAALFSIHSVRWPCPTARALQESEGE